MASSFEDTVRKAINLRHYDQHRWLESKVVIDAGQFGHVSKRQERRRQFDLVRLEQEAVNIRSAKLVSDIAVYIRRREDGIGVQSTMRSHNQKTIS